MARARRGWKAWGVALAVAALAAFCETAPASSAQAETGADVYSGTGAWVDVWDAALWAAPERTVDSMRRRGLRTLFLETSNSSRPYDLIAPDLVGRFIAAAHADGLVVVAWYLPTFRKPQLDRRRVLAALGFRTATGDGFDSVALDIESSAVRRPGLRTARLLVLAEALREAAGPAFPLRAIVPAPEGMRLRPAYWPGFPFRELAGLFDTFLPMAYFTYHTHGRADAEAYVRASVELLRTQAGDPTLRVHLVGGTASAARPSQLRGFLAAACAAGVDGLSLYDFASMKPWQWRLLGSQDGCASPGSGGATTSP